MEWKSNQTILVVGKKRSGKSQFVKTVVWPYLQDCVLFDKKFEHGDLASEKDVYICHNIEGVEELWNRGIHKIVYQPYDASQDNFNELCKLIFYKGNVTIWCDEVASIATPLNYPYYWGECMRLGQIRGIGVINVSQRPALIPSLCISEADIIVSFRLQLFKDAERICAIMGEVYIEELLHLPDYYFLMYDFRGVERCAPLELSTSESIEAGDIKNEENYDSEISEEETM